MLEDNKTLAAGLDQTFVALDLVPVSPSNTEDLPSHARALRIGTGGTLRVTTWTGEVRNTNVIDGEVLALYVRRVHSTGTSATGIEAML